MFMECPAAIERKHQKPGISPKKVCILRGKCSSVSVCENFSCPFFDNTEQGFIDFNDQLQEEICRLATGKI